LACINVPDGDPDEFNVSILHSKTAPVVTVSRRIFTADTEMAG
jgi:hypothetical protein